MEIVLADGGVSIDTSVVFRLIYEKAHDTSVLIMDKGGNILDCNPGFINSFGYTREEISGKNFSILFTEEDRKANLPWTELNTVLLKGACTTDSYLIDKTGSLKWIKCETILAASDGLASVYIIKIIFDSEKQKRLEELASEKTSAIAISQQVTAKISQDLSEVKEKLLQVNTQLDKYKSKFRKSRKFYEVLLANTADFIYSFDPDGRFTYVNKSLLDLWGLKSEDVIGKTFRELDYPEDLIEKHKVHFDLLRKEKKSLRDENFYTSPSGTRYYEYIFVPVLDEDGNLETIAGTTRDITHRHILEQELTESKNLLKVKNDQLQKVNAELSNFVYTASHDLKAPLTNIEGLIKTLMDELHEQEGYNHSEILEMINLSINRFKEVLNDLSQTGHEQTENAEIDLKEIINEVKLLLKDLIEAYKPVFIEKISVTSVNLSRKNIRSIFQNLISNAIKYSSPERKPLVEIGIFRKNRAVIIKIKDNGLGIKDEDRGKIFGLYNRLHDHVEGTGVGMTVVANIVDNAGGTIQVESEVDKGSTFTICLPG
jgi:PAS domain S-box-containing protein